MCFPRTNSIGLFFAQTDELVTPRAQSTVWLQRPAFGFILEVLHTLRLRAPNFSANADHTHDRLCHRCTVVHISHISIGGRCMTEKAKTSSISHQNKDNRGTDIIEGGLMLLEPIFDKGFLLEDGDEAAATL